ncbi:MAG: formate dehydrogenase accessory sulfurtransferase FdhD [Rhodospirillaceae bacterium]|nr:formate dehydrogenase accessory sulfurtransferase FdhD [Rhodospirillaceae bacterium]
MKPSGKSVSTAASGMEPSTRARAMRLRDGAMSPEHVEIAAEVPVALVYNSISHVVMMATPLDLADFGLGFSLSDRIIEEPGEMQAVEIIADARGYQVAMRIPPARSFALRGRRRNITGLTGCGLCGVETLDQVHLSLPSIAGGPTVDVAAIHGALAALPALQPLNRATGAIHAAAWSNLVGGIVIAREDVGRHNALDKLIGAMTRLKIDPADGFAVITSRCSFEMAQKAVAARIRVLVAISAPTSLALAVAERTGLTLVALARTDSVTVYANPERLSGTGLGAAP